MLASAVRSQNPTTVASGLWMSPATWASGIMPKDGDSVIISAGDSVWLDRSTPNLASLDIAGTLAMTQDTLLLAGSHTISDTAIRIRGTLDLGNAWFWTADPTALKSIVHLYPNSLFRTSISFPDTIALLDSSRAPLFAVDSGSTFEYYSMVNEVTDVSYLANNIIDGAYRNLLLTNITASFRSNPVTIDDTLHIGFGAVINTDARKNGSGKPAQQITIHGDVVNDNRGESGAAGGGFNGCGFQSNNTDTWIFDRSALGTSDTCHWSGPSQLGTVIVTPRTVLSVRFISDTICDSLDVLDSLIEQGAPCGGHVIGRIYSEIAPILDSTHVIDSFAGLGITIATGTNPYLGRTRVVRTSGYAPPNARAADLPALQYYAISAQHGTQHGIADEIRVKLHCDDLRAPADQLHFWRSRDRGATWTYSGITSIDAKRNLFVWDTATLSAPNDSGTFYWMLSEGYVDNPLPVELENFNVTQTDNAVHLDWSMGSEFGIAGYEVERSEVNSTALLLSYRFDKKFEAGDENYRYDDRVERAGPLTYKLYEITNDGIRTLLGTRSIDAVITDGISRMSYVDRALRIEGNSSSPLAIIVTDILGRIVLTSPLPSLTGHFDLPLALPPGAYYARGSSEKGEKGLKFVIFGK